MRRNQKDLGRDVRDIASRIVAIEESLGRALANLADSQPGYPSSSGGAIGAPALGEDGTPAGLERFVLTPDPAMAALADLDHHMAAARRSCIEAHRIVAIWAAGPAKVSPVDLAPGAGECVVCDRFAPGTMEDRIKAGLCPACYASWRRWLKANKGDRFDWMRTRRVELSDERERVEA